MIFTSFTYIAFLLATLALYWVIGNRKAQNVLLLILSYVFYGWIHPWFCWLMFASTLVDYGSALLMERYLEHKTVFMGMSLLGNRRNKGPFVRGILQRFS